MGETRWVKASAFGSDYDVLAHHAPAFHAKAQRKFLLIHGNPADWTDWDAIRPYLRRHGDVLSMDLPGFGASPRKPEQSVSLDAHADVAMAVARAFGWEDGLTVFGHSHGGAIAQTMAARHTESVSGLVLLGTLTHQPNPPYRFYPVLEMKRWLQGFAKVAMQPLGRPILRLYVIGASQAAYGPDPIPEGSVDDEVEKLLKDPKRALRVITTSAEVMEGNPSAQLWRQSGAIKAPILLVHGTKDLLVDHRHVQALAERFRETNKSVTLEIVEGAGHGIHVTRTNVLEEILERWMADSSS